MKDRYVTLPPDEVGLLTAVPTAEDLRARGHVATRWEPISHARLFHTVRELAPDLDFSRGDYRTSRDGMDFLAKVPHGVPNGVQHEIGWRHSHAQRWALTVVMGATIMVCSNGMIVGEQVVKVKHTPGNMGRLRETLAGVLYRAKADVAGAFERIRESLNGNVGDPLHAAQELVEGGVFPRTRLADVASAWPTEKERYGEARWALYQSVTAAAKGWPTTTRERALRRLNVAMGVAQ